MASDLWFPLNYPRFSHCGPLAIALLLVVAVSGPVAHAQPLPTDPAQNAAPRGQPEGRALGGKTDAHAMVEALANHNFQPKLDHEFRPHLGSAYDWSEKGRVWNAVNALIGNAEEAWPELVMHLDDDRYCLTVQTIDGFVYNWSVGEMCREIVGRNLGEACFQSVPLYELVYYRLRLPKIARDKKQLKAWCEARRERRLYELQIEVCQGAQPEVAKIQSELKIPDPKRHEWFDAINAKIESLRRSKVPVGWRRFGPEELVPYQEKPEPARE